MLSALRAHWPEYLMEAFGLGVFLFAACLVTALVEHPASPVRAAVASDLARRALVGGAMGVTLVTLARSAWGRRSGAHLNPVVTLAFWRLGRIAGWDAAFYAAAQTVGGLLGALAAGAVADMAVAHPAVRWAVTVPGAGGAAVAFVAETAISAGLLGTVLLTASRPRLAPWTTTCCGVLVALYITLEAPLSGMSMNPARTLASAVPAGTWDALWVYALAPALGMLGVAEAYRRRAPAAPCATLAQPCRGACLRCRAAGAARAA